MKKVTHKHLTLSKSTIHTLTTCTIIPIITTALPAKHK